MDEDTQVVEAPIEEESETQEPQEKKDRTGEQFQKLTESNKALKEKADTAEAEKEQLKEEVEKYKKLYEAPINQAPDAKQFANLDQNQVNEAFQSMMDENGYLDGNKLLTVLQTMDLRARQAEERALQAVKSSQDINKKITDRSEKEAQDRVYSKYPQLNPDNKETFDPKMWRAVYNELAVKAKAGENPTDQDYLDAADRVYTDFYADRDMNKQEKQQKEEIEEKKQQINAIKPTASTIAGKYVNSEEEDLLQKVREGKRGALAEMLNRRGQ